MSLFDPVNITSFISLSAAAIWAVCFVADKSKLVQASILIVTIVALVSSASLEWLNHSDPCANTPKLLLNEVCAEGKEQCDGGADFVEIYNPNQESVSLGCYAISDQRSAQGGGKVKSHPSLLPGNETIGSKQVRAWDENELGFRISRKGDRVKLHRVILEPGKKIDFAEIDQVGINNSGSYQARIPDGFGSWVPMSHNEVKAAGTVGSFGELNGEDLEKVTQ